MSTKIATLLAALWLATSAATTPEPPRIDATGVEVDVAAAIERRRTTVTQRPASAEAWGRLAAVYHAHGFHSAATECYRHAIELAPESFPWRYLSAVANEAHGAGPAAVDEGYVAAAQVDPTYAPLWLRLGLSRSQRGAFDDARLALERAAQLAPESALASRALGEVLLALERTDEAIPLLERAAILSPADAAARSALSRAHRLAGNAEPAREAAEQASRLLPDHHIQDPLLQQIVDAYGVSARHRFRRAQRLIADGSPRRALTDLSHVASVRPEDPDVAFLTFLALEAMGETRRSGAELRRALRLDAEHVRALVEMARRLARRDNTDGALTHYRRAHQASPRDPSILARWVDTAVAADRWNEALEVYGKLAELLPDDERIPAGIETARAQLAAAAAP